MTTWPRSCEWQFVPAGGGTSTGQGSALCRSTAPVPKQPPVANPGGPYASEDAVTLDGTQSRDPDNNTPLRYAWDWGDGTTATTATVTHTHPAGSCTVTPTGPGPNRAQSTPTAARATSA